MLFILFVSKLNKTFFFFFLQKSLQIYQVTKLIIQIYSNFTLFFLFFEDVDHDVKKKTTTEKNEKKEVNHVFLRN